MHRTVPYWLIVTCLAVPLAAGAQDYPTKPITVIVPYAPGGGTDLTMRLLEPAASQRLGQKLVLVNRPGAAGSVGHFQLTKAAPDGYTMAVVGVGSTAVQPHLASVGYRPADYVPFIQLNTVPFLLVTPTTSPFKTVRDVIEFAKRNPPGKLKVGITSRGSWLHLVMARVEKLHDVKFTYIPHGSTGEIVVAIMGGHLDLGNADIPSAGPKVTAGLLRGLGVFTGQRLKDFPEIPTLKEQGTEVEGFFYNILIAPKGTPDKVIQALHEAFKAAMEEPEVIRKAEQAGIRFEYLGPSASRAQIDQFYEMAGVLLRELGLKK
jgi:tripartite-type tricarboxylate transporter receptor subunit TctC